MGFQTLSQLSTLCRELSALCCELSAATSSPCYQQMGQKVKEGDAVKREQLKWTPVMDTLFIQSMLNQQYEGHRIDGTFTSQAYANMVAEMRQKLNMDLNKEHLKNRLKTLKEHFSQCYDLFRGVGLSGFSWNSETRLFEATEDVWDQLLAVSNRCHRLQFFFLIY